MISEDIKNYAKQFDYEPIVENAPKLKRCKKFIVCGMGGSHLAADILRAWHPEVEIIVWSNYGLPPLHEKDLKEYLIIASSYSGSTEETIDAFTIARTKHFPLAVLAANGKLIRLAQKFNVPYVQMPDFHSQPRMATGLSIKGLVALMGERTWLGELKLLGTQLHPAREESRGKDLAKRLHGTVPVIYSSARNAAIGYNWKIKFNETGKIPAFTNVVPELNHNEMNGFDVKPKTSALSRQFHFVFLKDGDDDPRLIKRMSILEKLYRERGFTTEVILLQGKSVIHKTFNALILADWTAFHSAKLYGVEPEQVPMVQEFKKLMERGRA